MGKAVEDLKRVLERMQKDLDKAPVSFSESFREPAHAPPAQAVSAQPLPQPVADKQTRNREPQEQPLSPLRFPILHGGTPAPVAGFRPSSASLHRALLLGWVAVSLGGIWSGDVMITALGLLGIVWMELRASVISGMRTPSENSADMEDLSLRVTALEKRVAALKYGAGAATSSKMQEDIVELKTILKSLFKALEEPEDQSGKSNEED